MHFLKEWPPVKSILTIILQVNTVIRSNRLNLQKQKRNFIIIFRLLFHFILLLNNFCHIL